MGYGNTEGVLKLWTPMLLVGFTTAEEVEPANAQPHCILHEKENQHRARTDEGKSRIKALKIAVNRVPLK